MELLFQKIKKERMIRMQYFIDTANLESIKKISDIFPIAGVTTNPTIIAKEKRDFKEIINDIFDIIGKNKIVHAQAVGSTAEIMVKEVQLLRDTFGENFYTKIPVTPEGIKAIKIMAAEAGAEYMAPYINRSDNIGENGIEIVKDAYKILEMTKKTDEEKLARYKRIFEPKILGASFKNVRQVHETILAGSKSVTVAPEVFEKLIYHPYTDWSMDTFNSDWEKVYGEKTLLDLL